MNYIFWIILGLIIGWVIEWVIDWLFWRKPGEQSLEKLTLAEAENERLQAQLAEAEQKLTNLTLTEREAKICQVKLADAEETIEQLCAELNAIAGQAPQEEDLLERIKGVWTSFARRFSASGIFTFAQLAESKPERVREIINPEEWQEIEPESWIARAKVFAQEKAEASRRILGQYREYEQLHERLLQLEAENGWLQALAAGGASLSLTEHEAQTRTLQFGDTDLNLDPFRPGLGVQTDFMPARKDRLEEIEGIGPVYAKRLNEAGLFSFWQLAEQTPERVREIINPEAWQKIDAESWIAQARAMADPDQLEDIVGIGEVYAQRLNQAGIYTFAQLAELTPERLEEIVEVDEPQIIDAESWIAQAKGFAFKKAQHTRALGSRGRQMPQYQDPLEEIDGIGPVYAERLNEAGIFSFWQLAQQSPERVREMIDPEDWQKIDATSWIAQAKVLASPDKLEDINGIGIVFAKRLNEAGIYTFAQLAELTPEQIKEIIQPEKWQKIEPEKWIAQANELATKKSNQAATGV